MTTVDSIASQLPNMNASDLSKIKQLADMLLGGQTMKQVEDPTERIVFEALRAELEAAGIKSHISYGSLIESRYCKSWKRGVGVVSNFIDKSFKGHAETEAQRIGLCRILIQTMIRDFKSKDIPVSIGTIANNLHRVPQTFDNAFPNYLQSGLAYLVPRALLRNKKP